MTTSAPQQISLNPFQMLAITDRVLLDLKTYFERRLAAGEESHPDRNGEACKSLHHSRLLLGIRQRELMMEVARAQEAAKLSTLRADPKGAVLATAPPPGTHYYEKALAHELATEFRPVLTASASAAPRPVKKGHGLQVSKS